MDMQAIAKEVHAVTQHAMTTVTSKACDYGEQLSGRERERERERERALPCQQGFLLGERERERERETDRERERERRDFGEPQCSHRARG